MSKHLHVTAVVLSAAFLGVLDARAASAAEQLSIGPAIELLPGKEAYQRRPAIAFGGGGYLVVWQDGWNGEGGDSNILGARVSPQGKVLNGTPIAICTAPGIQETPAVAWTGKDFLVVWSDLRNGKDCDIYMGRVSPDGKVTKTDAPVIAKEHSQAWPQVAASEGTALVVWQDLRDGENYSVFGTRVGDSGDVLDRDGFQLGKGLCARPSVAASADGFLVAWEHRAGPFLCVGGARVGRDGKLLGAIPEHGFHGAASFPAIAGDGKDFLFVCTRVPFPNYWGWGGGSAVYGARVLADGSTPDLKTVPQYQWKLFPNVIDGSWLRKDGTWPHRYAAVAWDGKQYVAVWTRAHIQNQVMLTNFDIFATRIRFPDWQRPDGPDGPVPDKAWEMKNPPAPGIPLAATADSETLPTLAAGRSGALLAAYEVHKPDGAIVITAKVLTAP